MGEKWVTTKALYARLDGKRLLPIPADETIEVTYRGNGIVRIYWKGNKEGLGGATVDEADLEASARKA